MDDSKEFKLKLNELYNDRGITKRLRTHLRQLILSEMQNSTADKKYPPINIKSRAIGSLIVEWLQVHGCHYTLSVLASEIPSLADLPMLSSEGSQNKLQVDDAKDILRTLGLDYEEIMNEYVKQDLSLIVCLFKIASSWKDKLEFKYLPRSPRYTNENEPSWCGRLRDIVAATLTPSENLSALYSSLYSLIQSEVEECITHERRSLFDELLLRENSIKEKLKEQEASILSKVLEVRQGFTQTKDKVEEELTERRNIVLKLMEEVQAQHQTVITGLSELKMKEEQLESNVKAWRKNKEREHLRLGDKMKHLIERELELNKKMEMLALKETQLNEKLISKIMITQGTCTSFLNFDDEVRNQHGQMTSTSLRNKPLLLKQRTIGKEKDGVEKVVQMDDHIFSTTTSESSSVSFDETDEKKGATLRRIAELREETKRNNQGFLESRRVFDSDSSSSESEGSPNLLNLHRRNDGPSTSFNRRQVTFPYLREGCHSASTSQIFPTVSHISTSRYKHLLSHGDQNLNSSQRLLKKKVEHGYSEKSNVDATIKLKEQSKILDNLIRATRKNSPVLNKKYEYEETPKLTRKSKKISSLMEAVRSFSPQPEVSLKEDETSDKGKVQCEIITEESNMVGAGEACDTNEFSKPTNDSENMMECYEMGTNKSTQKEVTSVPEKLQRLEIQDLMILKKNEISESPSRGIINKIKESKSPVHRQPSLMQAALENNSEISEGEIVSIGRHSVSSDNFWS